VGGFVTRFVPHSQWIRIPPGFFRSDDAGESWRLINRGLKSDGIPDQEAEVGHCVHRIAMHPRTT
jgi:hypothetical protein